MAADRDQAAAGLIVPVLVIKKTAGQYGVGQTGIVIRYVRLENESAVHFFVRYVKIVLNDAQYAGRWVVAGHFDLFGLLRAGKEEQGDGRCRERDELKYFFHDV